MFLEKIANTKAKEIRALHDQISPHDCKRAKRLPNGLSLKEKLAGTEAGRYCRSEIRLSVQRGDLGKGGSGEGGQGI